MPQSFFHTFTLDDESEVAVEYTATGGDPGIYSGPYEGSYPATAPEIEILKAHDNQGNTVFLTQEQDEKFCDWLAENHEDDEPDYGVWGDE